MQARDDQGFHENHEPRHELSRIELVDEVLAGIVAEHFRDNELAGPITPEVLLRIRRGDDPD